MDTALVFGLGNAGPEYASTRHNIGQMVLAELAHRLGTSFRAQGGTGARSGALVATGAIPGKAKILLAKSTGYMNTSGGPVRNTENYYDLGNDQLIVVHDDLDIPFGQIRIKQGGGHAGHNGLRDIISATGNKDFTRVRMGIGRPPGRMDVADFVLKQFASSERDILPTFLAEGADAVETIVTDGIAAAQQKFHTS